MFSYFSELLAWKKQSYILFPFWPLMFFMAALGYCYFTLGTLVPSKLTAEQNAELLIFILIFILIFLCSLLMGLFMVARDVLYYKYHRENSRLKAILSYSGIFLLFGVMSFVCGYFAENTLLSKQKMLLLAYASIFAPAFLCNPFKVYADYTEYLLYIHCKHWEHKKTNIITQFLFYIVSLLILVIGLIKKDFPVEKFAAAFGVGSDYSYRGYDYDHIQCDRVTAALPFYRKYRAPQLLAKFNGIPLKKAKKICVVN